MQKDYLGCAIFMGHFNAESWGKSRNSSFENKVKNTKIKLKFGNSVICIVFFSQFYPEMMYYSVIFRLFFQVLCEVNCVTQFSAHSSCHFSWQVHSFLLPFVCLDKEKAREIINW